MFPCKHFLKNIFTVSKDSKIEVFKDNTTVVISSQKSGKFTN